MERNVGNNLRIDIWLRDPCPRNPLHPYYMVDPTIIQAFNSNQPTLPATKQKLKQAYTQKKQTYADAALANSATVIPLAFTSFGAYHHEFKTFLQHMKQIAVSTGNHFPAIESSFTNYWPTNIIFTIARSIAKNSYEAAKRHKLALLAQMQVE